MATGHQLRHRSRTGWPTRTTAPAGPVTTVRVHPRVWAAALAQVDGDASRLRVISPTRVEVR